MAKKVGEITHSKSGICVPFFLEGTKFTCTCLEQTFTESDARILEEKVKDFIEHWMTLEWHPVIFVEFSLNDGWGSSKRTGIWLDAKRVFLSKSPAGQVLECDWDADASHRKALCRTSNSRELRLANLPLGAPLKVAKGTIWMDHTEEKWNAIARIREGIDKLGDMLMTLLTTVEGNALLQNQETTLRLWAGDISKTQ
jgi:hypothetical protein